MAPQANRAIAVAALVTFGTIVFSDVERSSALPSSHEWIGYVTAFLVISAAADMGFEPAGGIAVLVMVAAVLSRGQDALAYVTKRTGPKVTRHGPPAGPQGPILPGGGSARLAPAIPTDFASSTLVPLMVA